MPTAAISERAAAMRKLRERLDVSIPLFADMLGFEPRSGPRRVRRWEDGDEEPSSSAVRCAAYLAALYDARKAADRFEIEHALEFIDIALPAELR